MPSGFSADPVRQVERSAIVPYSPQQMFELVADVERYPEFLPWCAYAELHSRDDRELTGSLGLAQGPLTGRFTTRNRLDAPHAMSIELLEGPFRNLHGQWRFDALGEQGCRIALQMRFEFDSRVNDLLLGPVFEQTCNRLVDAFVARAGVVYGS